MKCKNCGHELRECVVAYHGDTAPRVWYEHWTSAYAKKGTGYGTSHVKCHCGCLFPDVFCLKASLFKIIIGSNPITIGQIADKMNSRNQYHGTDGVDFFNIIVATIDTLRKEGVISINKKCLISDIVDDNMRREACWEVILIKKDCGTCKHVTTPKGKQCYTISRTIKEKIRDKGLPFFPEHVIPVLNKLANSCKRYTP